MPYLGTQPPAIPISGTDIQAGTIETANIADDAVTLAKIADVNVSTAKIANNAVTLAKIADVNVTTAKIANDAITTAKIADVNVTTAKIADVNVTTAKIADDAVTLAKLAAGTDGELITWDASGNPAAVPVGTATHVLTSNGTGAAPTFQEASGGALELVSTTNVTVGASTTEITGFDATADHWRLVISNMHNSALADIQITMSDDGGATFESSLYGAVNMMTSPSAINAFGNAGSDVDWTLTNGSSSRPGGSATWPIDGYIDIFHPGNAAINPSLMWDITHGNDTPAEIRRTCGAGNREAVSVLTDLKIAMSSGTHTGRFTLYKIKHA